MCLGVRNMCLLVETGCLDAKKNNKKEEKTPANMHITCVLGCKDKNDINKPPKHTYVCPGDAKKENKQKKAPETQYAVFLVQGKKRKETKYKTNPRNTHLHVLEIGRAHV